MPPEPIFHAPLRPLSVALPIRAALAILFLFHHIYLNWQGLNIPPRRYGRMPDQTL